MSCFERLNLSIPIIQGGMGIGVSLSSLAGSVAAQGAMGVISTANPGYDRPDFWKNPAACNMEALRHHIKRAKELAKGQGVVAINAMVATARYTETVAAAIQAGVDAIISGAGLPLHLPSVEGAEHVALAPIVSGAKAISTICKLWDKRFNRVPDFVVVEGSQAGGHLGFSKEEVLEGKAKPLHMLVEEVCQALVPWQEKYHQAIPVFAAGGVLDGADIAKMEQHGAYGVQMATSFIATEECDASEGYKKAILAAKDEDVRIVQSPVGMPGRGLASPLLDKLAAAGRIAPSRCANCLVPCNPLNTPYCITHALIEAVKGNWEEGLFFCGGNVGKINQMTTVPALIRRLTEEWKQAKQHCI